MAFLSSCGKQEEPVAEPVVETTIEETPEIETAVNQYQADFFNKFNETQISASEKTTDLKHTITEEEAKVLEKEWNYVVPADNMVANFAFEGLERFATNVRFINYSNEELAKITGGQELDIGTIMDSSDSLSNLYMTDTSELLFLGIQENKVMEYYNIREQFPDITEQQASEFERFQTKANEYAKLLAEGKEKDAEKLMQEIRDDFEYYIFSSTNDEDTFKPFVARVWGTTFSIESQMRQYKHDLTLTVFDTKTGDNVEKTIKGTALFDEVLMRNAVLGWQDCSTIDVNGNAVRSATIEGLSDRYAVVMDEATAEADRFNSNELERFEDYNNWIVTLKSENTQMDSSVIGQFVLDHPEINVTYVNGEWTGLDANVFNYVNSNSEYDQLVQGSQNVAVFFAEMDVQLEAEGLKPSNMPYYEYLMYQYFIEYKNTHGRTAVTQGKPGDTIPAGQTQVHAPIPDNADKDPNAIFLNADGVQVEYVQLQEEAREKWRQEQQAKYDAEGEGRIAFTSVEEKDEALQEKVQEVTQKVEEQVKQESTADHQVTAVVFAGEAQEKGTLPPDGTVIQENIVSEEHHFVDSTGKDLGTTNAQVGTDEYKRAEQNAINNATIIIDDQFKNAQIFDTPQDAKPMEDRTTTQTSTTVTRTETGDNSVNTDKYIYGDMNTDFGTTTINSNGGSTGTVDYNVNVNINTGNINSNTENNRTNTSTAENNSSSNSSEYTNVEPSYAPTVNNSVNSSSTSSSSSSSATTSTTEAKESVSTTSSSSNVTYTVTGDNSESSEYEYTYEDPTKFEGFAPVVEDTMETGEASVYYSSSDTDDSISFAPVIDEVVESSSTTSSSSDSDDLEALADSIIEEMSSVSESSEPTEEVTEGKSL